MDTKICRVCKQPKAIDDFCKVSKNSEKRTNCCRDCNKAKCREWYSRNAKQSTARAIKWNKDNQEKYRAYKLWYQYRLTEHQYEAMLLSQGGVCAICFQPETTQCRGKAVKMAVDHCHKTGKVRQLLCRRCNQGLGGFRDDPSLMVKAAAYIEKHRRSNDGTPEKETLI